MYCIFVNVSLKSFCDEEQHKLRNPMAITRLCSCDRHAVLTKHKKTRLTKETIPHKQCLPFGNYDFPQIIFNRKWLRNTFAFDVKFHRQTVFFIGLCTTD